MQSRRACASKGRAAAAVSAPTVRDEALRALLAASPRLAARRGRKPPVLAVSLPPNLVPTTDRGAVSAARCLPGAAALAVSHVVQPFSHMTSAKKRTRRSGYVAMLAGSRSCELAVRVQRPAGNAGGEPERSGAGCEPFPPTEHAEEEGARTRGTLST